jgi:hypothetical protein
VLGVKPVAAAWRSRRVMLWDAASAFANSVHTVAYVGGR